MSTKTAIITGAAGGLGRTVTQRLLDAGFTVYAAISTKDDPQFIDHEQLKTFPVDLTNESEAERFVMKVMNDSSRIDLSLMIVGGFAVGDIRNANQEVIEKMYRLNFETAYFIARPVFQQMENQSEGGQIIMIGSRPALEPAEGKNYVAYALSKSMLFNLSEILNEEGKGKNITSTIIVPSTIDTPGTRAAIPDANFEEWIKPDEIADTLTFLCTPAGRKLRHSVLKLYGNS